MMCESSPLLHHGGFEMLRTTAVCQSFRIAKVLGRLLEAPGRDHRWEAMKANRYMKVIIVNHGKS